MPPTARPPVEPEPEPVEMAPQLCAAEFPAESGVFVAGKEGVIVIEIESHSPNGWTPGSTFAGFLGEGYLLDPGGAGALSYRFRIDTPGSYRVSLRSYIDNDNNTESNDVVSTIDGREDVKLFSHGLGQGHQWTWDTGLDLEGQDLDLAYYAPPNEFPAGHEFIKPPGYVFAAGVHEFAMKGRSSGFAIDRLHIYPDGLPETEALNLSLPQSGQVQCE
jgi:hypothetical protein